MAITLNFILLFSHKTHDEHISNRIWCHAPGLILESNWVMYVHLSVREKWFCYCFVLGAWSTASTCVIEWLYTSSSLPLIHHGKVSLLSVNSWSEYIKFKSLLHLQYNHGLEYQYQHGISRYHGIFDLVAWLYNSKADVFLWRKVMASLIFVQCCNSVFTESDVIT